MKRNLLTFAAAAWFILVVGRSSMAEPGGSPTASSELVVTNTVLDPEGLELSGSGGVSHGPLLVAASFDIATPVAEWSPVATNVFDAAGRFRVLAPRSLRYPQQFFKVVATDDSTPDWSPVGFATVEGTVTGGQGTMPVTVQTLSELRTAVQSNSPRLVQVSGTINLGQGNLDVGSNTTLAGLGTNATLVGNLRLNGVNNVIIRNLHLTNPAGAGGGDGLAIIDGAHHIWIDHCTFLDCADGQCDITRAADYVTVSWCKFSYPGGQSDHRFSVLIGAGDSHTEDRGKLRITFHHNWWSSRCRERMPRVRYGHVHGFNNYYAAPDNNYCVRAAIASELLVENNYFFNVRRPYEKYSSGGTEGKIRAVGNDTSFATGVTHYQDEVFTPPYSYDLDTVVEVPDLVRTHAGAGRGPFAKN